MSLDIRTATLADIPLIRDLAHRTWPHTFGEILTPAQIDYMLEMMYSEESLHKGMTELAHQYFIGFAEGPIGQPESEVPVCYAGYQFDYLPGTTKLHKIYVLPEGQKHGYGKALFSAVAKTAHDAGQLRFRLDVNYHNAASGFYERMGMTKIDEVTTEIGEGYLMEDWVFEMELS
ncbi:MAG: GNAT family N-acetyltransferase [Saprospiraceae bacterium]